ncbi:DUF1987 domain-containing protein [Paludibacterium yongneupense]|uniref:DUF1987 domain-containing protein n=1 Tax=Paludibacterium yongneupense TaxID=400061 RepID=UPI000427656E|nr:DUF1987 domain-containing protein [Paludibacterium yongneupense]
MNRIQIAATAATPEIDFDFAAHVLSLRGESYPENAQAFYGPVLAELEAYLATHTDRRITVNVQLAYFNSSSTKLLMSLFERLNTAALAGNSITLNWHYDEDDDTILEFGQEVADDNAALDFHAMALA